MQSFPKLNNYLVSSRFHPIWQTLFYLRKYQNRKSINFLVKTKTFFSHNTSIFLDYFLFPLFAYIFQYVQRLWWNGIYWKPLPPPLWHIYIYIYIYIYQKLPLLIFLSFSLKLIHLCWSNFRWNLIRLTEGLAYPLTTLPWASARVVTVKITPATITPILSFFVPFLFPSFISLSLYYFNSEEILL